MSLGARLDDLHELRRFRARLLVLGDQVQTALMEAESDLTRTADWLSRTQSFHWREQLRARTEEFGRARSALTRRKNEKSPAGGRQSCVEEERLFKIAQRRLEEAEQKSAAVKRWERKLDEAAYSYRPMAQSLRSMVEIDVARAVARLDQMLAALEMYTAERPAPEMVVSEAANDSMRRSDEPDDVTPEPESAV
jgi:hypothetical protein